MALINYFLAYIDVDIIKEMEDIAKNIGDLQQKFIENTGIPRNRLGIDLGDTEGDIGTETVYYGNKIVDHKKIKIDEKDT